MTISLSWTVIHNRVFGIIAWGGVCLLQVIDKSIVCWCWCFNPHPHPHLIKRITGAFSFQHNYLLNNTCFQKASPFKYAYCNNNKKLFRAAMEKTLTRVCPLQEECSERQVFARATMSLRQSSFRGESGGKQSHHTLILLRSCAVKHRLNDNCSRKEPLTWAGTLTVEGGFTINHTGRNADSKSTVSILAWQVDSSFWKRLTSALVLKWKWKYQLFWS